ncbi:MAG: cation:proton antiporter [Syntrophales bacterium]|nr:cation:proton antiporter [Syntrophales bacterium]
MYPSILTDIITIFGLSVAVIIIFHKIRIPPVVGFIVTGILAGPFGLQLIESSERVNALAEVGIIALLFTIGLEFSLRNLSQIGRSIAIGGTTQVTATILAGMLICIIQGYPWGQSLFFGFLLSLSSTAIVMKVAQDRGEIESPHGRSALGILIFQDLIVILMILISPLIAGSPGDPSISPLEKILKGIVAVLIIAASAKWFVPYLLLLAAKTKNREVFILTVIIIGLSIAWLTHMAGLSLALGSFLAGLIISESEYSHQAAGNILPFRDVLMSFFFVSVGMLINMEFLLRHAALIGLLIMCVVVMKSLTGTIAVLFQGLPPRTAIIAGMYLSQIGEFSFILAKTGVEQGILTETSNAIFISVSALTMALTPLTMELAPKVAIQFLKLPLPKSLKNKTYTLTDHIPPSMKDHMIIVGFGLNGRNVARAARIAKIPYIIVEMNPETVRRERKTGEQIIFGDATSEEVLKYAGIKKARTMVVVINDAAATRRITELARRLNPKLHIIVRTRFIGEMDSLYKLGADEVIPEEFETSVEIFSRVLRRYLIPKPEIERLISEIRADGYEMFRTISKEAATCMDIRVCLPDTEIATVRLEKKAYASGKNINDLALRKRFGVTILAIRRNGSMIHNPDANTVLMEGDVLVLFGEPFQISSVLHLFTEPMDR